MGTVPAVLAAKEAYGKRKHEDRAVTAQTKRQRRVLHEEFTALTGVDMEKKLLEFINNYGHKCLDLLKRGGHSAKEAAKKLEEELQQPDENVRKYRFAVGLIERLPLLVKEKPKFLSGPDIYPTLRFEGTSIQEAEYITVTFEAFSIDVVDVIAGISALMELYWVLDIRYSESNKHTLALLEHFCDLPSAPKSTLLLRTISSIQGGRTSMAQK
ncbi:hypothetical protein HPB50_010556 [Hyalomma asiaticum]|uniref:Uncharacterized protein n=1 Tax=Hyalomma asiaticum TaxID=266040 RepID=A0ACB7TEF3_HYAAI|nr:hypothetical protein HPB50_010556 [Hyalomma asiaticum]